jgi:hypothetical protein
MIFYWEYNAVSSVTLQSCTAEHLDKEAKQSTNKLNSSVKFYHSQYHKSRATVHYLPSTINTNILGRTVYIDNFLHFFGWHIVCVVVCLFPLVKTWWPLQNLNLDFSPFFLLSEMVLIWFVNIFFFFHYHFFSHSLLFYL